MLIGFVNGSYHGSWYFDKVINFLLRDGIRAFPVLSNTFIDFNESIDMADCIDMISERISNYDEKVILVGHSSGGQIISNYSEVYPEKVEKLIYVSGTLLPSGYCNFDIPREEKECPKIPKSQIQGDYKWYLAQSQEEKKLIYNYFYNRCPYVDAEKAISKLQPQSLRVLYHKNIFTQENFGKIDKYYIKCLDDHVIFPTVQDRMINLVGCKKIYEIDSDHVPFLSKPYELYLLLKNIVEE